MRALLALVFALALTGAADAASRFWVGGTGTWDASDTTHWASSSGGAGGQSVPGSSDTVTFDGSSGGGTVTLGAGYNPTIQSLTMGAFTGTLDFSANDNNITLNLSGLAVSITGTGTRTLNMGDGTWTITNNTGNGTLWDASTTTNLTFNANSSTISLTGSTLVALRTFAGGGLTYNNLNIASTSGGGAVALTGANTFNTITVAAPSGIQFTGGATTTISSLVATGTSFSNMVQISSSSSASAATVSDASGTNALTYVTLRSITATGGATFTATNSADLKNNTGITITPPVIGGAGIIGG